MLKLASQLRGLPIYSLRDGTKIGVIQEPVIDPQNGRFLAAVTEKPTLLRRARIVGSNDLREITAEVAIVDSADVLTDPSEIIRVSELLRTHYALEKRPVETQSGQSLGTVTDYEIELQTNALLRLHVRTRLLAKQSLIDFHDIVRIEPKRVLVRDLIIPSRPSRREVVPKVTPGAAPSASSTRLSQH